MEGISLNDELHLLEKDYTAVAMIVMAALKQNKIPPSLLYHYIFNLPQHLLKPKYKKLIEKRAQNLKDATSIDELFVTLSPYCDFLNPDLLEQTAERFADEITSSIVDTYVKRLREFRRKTRIGDIAGRWVAITPPDYVEVHLELDVTWKKKTLEDLEVFRSYPSRTLWFFKQAVKQDGLEVVFSVPRGVWLYQEDLENLTKSKVLTVREGGRYLVKLDQQKEATHTQSRRILSHGFDRSASDSQLDLLTDTMTFSLHNEILFGFHRQAGKNVYISRSSFKAMTVEEKQGSGLVYAAIPFRGVAEFEVKLLDYNIGIRGSLKLGVMHRKANLCSSQVGIPKLSEHRDNSCVWFKSTFKPKTEFQNNLGGVHMLRYYGWVNLGELRKDDCIGLQLTLGGDLSFFVNGVSQGLAAECVYREGYDLFCFIELVEGCQAIEITRAGIN